jgi:predicted transposase/invertase (TIGR01784 family)
MNNPQKTTTKKSKKNAPHDALIKKVIENPIAAAELLDEYLPAEFKAAINLDTVKVEKESFVEKNLTKQLSDIVLSVQTKEGGKAFVYILLEAQVKPDYLMALRLWKYTLLLCERHIKDKEKFPLVCPILFYHGTRKYDAPRNLWDLFTNPVMAKDLLTNDYPLIDLEAMKDDQINYNKHLSIILYLMKHIHQRDYFKLIEDIFKHCYKAILIDRQQDYLYIKLILWYINNRVPVEQKQQLERLIKANFEKEDSENVMRSIAQAYRDEGIAIGEARGAEKRNLEIAINMLKENADSKFVSKVTGFSLDEILKLKNKL